MREKIGDLFLEVTCPPQSTAFCSVDMASILLLLATLELELVPRISFALELELVSCNGFAPLVGDFSVGFAPLVGESVDFAPLVGDSVYFTPLVGDPSVGFAPLVGDLMYIPLRHTLSSAGCKCIDIPQNAMTERVSTSLRNFCCCRPGYLPS